MSVCPKGMTYFFASRFLRFAAAPRACISLAFSGVMVLRLPNMDIALATTVASGI